MRKLRMLKEARNFELQADDATKAAWKMAAGAALVAEGAFGAISRLSDHLNPFDRRDNGRGIIGAFFGMLIALVFVAIGFFMLPDPPADEVEVTGEVVAVEQTTRRDSDGNTQTMHTPTYGYTTEEGETRQFESSVSTGSRPTVGDPVTIGYSPSDPSFQRRIGGAESMMPWAVLGIGSVVLLVAGWAVLVKSLMIIGGMKLFVDGRREREAAGSDQSFFADLKDIIADRERMSGALSVLTGSGSSAAEPGTHRQGTEQVLQEAVAQDTQQQADDSQQAPQPDAGWYAAPDGSQEQRWWDGTQWTDRTR